MRIWLMIDLLRPCRRHELVQERQKLDELRREHHELAQRAVRHAGNTKEALEGVSILMTAAEIERLFERRERDRERASGGEPGREP